ncbi:NAD-dependent epimerase/dehydratase family protein [Paenibacillus sp. TSA_86.1]|uniref:NAD-dependent epimerase/dehydratase family protein n=1 Tax=Paenibacillus sp. TSA_86.1 TaxID=3415649 RepID=UPI004045FD9B
MIQKKLKYVMDIKKVADQDLNWNKLTNKKIVISGASGMIGRFLIDVIMYRNKIYQDNISIIALGRKTSQGIAIFKDYLEDVRFQFIPCDINDLNTLKGIETVDFVIHAASKTHPLEYSNTPIDTILINTLGTNNMLELAAREKGTRFVMLSSVEVYGENRGDVEEFNEDYSGYIDCNTLRAGYPEGKRVSEALCQAYSKEKNVDFVTVRLARVFGPTMNMDDSKALSQLIKNAINQDDVVLKSEGNQYFSYCYVGDAVLGILKIMLESRTGECYNLSGKNGNITLKELATYLANLNGKQIRFEIADEVEKIGYSKASKAILNLDKLKQLNWSPIFDIKESLKNTVELLQE